MPRWRDCIQPSRVCGTRNRPALPLSPSTSMPSPPTTTNKATTRPCRKPRLSPIRQRSIAFLSAIAAIASRLAMLRPCSGRIPRMRWQPQKRKACFSALSIKKTRRLLSQKRLEAFSQSFATVVPLQISGPICRRVSASSFSHWRRTRHGSRCGSTSRMISA